MTPEMTMNAFPHEYLVGLPVWITVWSDGTVEYHIDTTEAGASIRDEPAELIGEDDEPIVYTDDEVDADAAAIDADHERRTRKD